MKNIKKMALIALLLLILIPVLMVMINRQKSSRLERMYSTPIGSSTNNNLVIQELAIPGSQLVSQSDERKAVSQSYLRYDPLKKLVIIVSEGLSEQKQVEPASDMVVYTSFFNSEGKLVDQKSRLYRADTSGLESTELLENKILPFQHWKDSSKEIYLRHFGISDFDFSSLNPFQFGSINGGTPLYAWSGTGYYDLKMGGIIAKLKFPAKKEQVFFTEKNSYTTDLKLFHLPMTFNGTEAKILMYAPKGTKPEVFLIHK